MPRTTVIPDSQIVLLPLEPYLSIMVLRHEVEKVREKEVRLVLCDTVDAFSEAFVNVYRVPARHGCREKISGCKAKN